LANTHQRADTGGAAAEGAKVFKLSFEHLHIYRSKVAIFAEKKQNRFINVMK